MFMYLRLKGYMPTRALLMSISLVPARRPVDAQSPSSW